MRRRRLYREKILIGAATRKPDGRPGRNPDGSLDLFRDPIHDGEHFCSTILSSEWEGRNHWEPWDEWEDALQEMLLRAFRLEQLFDPGRSRSFEQYARYILRLRTIDVSERRLLGRSGNRLHNYLHDQLDAGAADGRPGLAVAAIEGDQGADRGQDPGWLQAERDRARARSILILGLGSPQRAA